ncbi:193_t:CDS:2 [Cetraspora pellucida]|uniref:193_t:CDS:1 n=1 Tax=Cetraspora pellucida TaxID=1433469 RepID=A0A9N8W2B4_9GLOM|nr:193_t:CDS:2 [Cetraspora pellucida]
MRSVKAQHCKMFGSTNSPPRQILKEQIFFNSKIAGSHYIGGQKMWKDHTRSSTTDSYGMPQEA